MAEGEGAQVGLMGEYFQEYDIIWRGENGGTNFLQNEKSYDPQNQKILEKS